MLTSVSKYIGKFDLFSYIFRRLFQVTSGKFTSSPFWAPVVTAEFLSKTKPSPLQFPKCAAMYPDNLHAKWLTKAAPLQNISPTSSLPTSTTPVVIDMLKTTRWTTLHHYVTVQHQKPRFLICVMPKMRFLVGGQREQHGLRRGECRPVYSYWDVAGYMLQTTSPRVRAQGFRS